MRLAILAIALALPLAAPIQAADYVEQRVAAENAPATVTVAPTNEPGDRLIVTGQVIDTEGHPVRGASIWVYHTDAKRLYALDGSQGGTNPRLPVFAPLIRSAKAGSRVSISGGTESGLGL